MRASRRLTSAAGGLAGGLLVRRNTHQVCGKSDFGVVRWWRKGAALNDRGDLRDPIVLLPAPGLSPDAQSSNCRQTAAGYHIGNPDTRTMAIGVQLHKPR